MIVRLINWLSMLAAVAVVPAISISAPLAAQSSTCSGFSGASIIADDGEYLGSFTNEYNSNSVFNKYGTYGSKYSSNSIWNDYGTYGGKYSSKSPFNPYTTTPPYLVKNGEAFARLTVNKYLNGAVNPMFLAISCFGYETE